VSSDFLENLHDCALTCEEFAGYVPWLAAPSPLAGVPPFSEMAWGAALLAVAAVGWCFWRSAHPSSGGQVCESGATPFGCAGVAGATPGISTHNVIGIVAVVPLLIWGLTGLNFEIPGFAGFWTP
jgi:hypothetical protein